MSEQDDSITHLALCYASIHLCLEPVFPYNGIVTQIGQATAHLVVYNLSSGPFHALIWADGSIYFHQETAEGGKMVLCFVSKNAEAFLETFNSLSIVNDREACALVQQIMEILA